MPAHRLGPIMACALLAVILQLSSVDTARCLVNERSRFYDAHVPLSVLDFEVIRLEELWNRLFGNDPDPSAYDSDPLLARAGIWIQIIYNDLADVLEVSALVTDCQGFARMSVVEREQLLVDIVDTLPIWYGPSLFIVEGKCSTETFLRTEFFRVSLAIDVPPLDGTGLLTYTVPLPWFDGRDMKGQAGYADGRFVYSNSSYLQVSLTEDGWKPASGGMKYVVREE